jgi:16S rRNA (cytosine1402-N4)-methyltransferase
MSLFHVPVLAAEIGELAAGAARVVDGTLGDGGHAARFLEAGARVLGVDRDPGALRRAGERLAGWPLQVHAGSVFDGPALAAVQAFRPDFVLLDLGVSSRQLDEEERGFTFRPGAPLDMRMSGTGPTAADWLNGTPPEALERAFRAWADEPRAARLARVVGRRRERQPLAVSDDLVNAIREALGPRSGPADFARIFQAVRIAVNDELGGLERGLPALRDALEPGGTLAVISYHSGEDRLVKHAFREWSRACVCPREFPVCRCRGRPLGRAVGARAVTPGAAEIAANPRARSARLRAFRVAAERVDDA